jgi:quinolinate synthase
MLTKNNQEKRECLIVSTEFEIAKYVNKEHPEKDMV